MSNKNIRIILDDEEGNSQAVKLSDIPTKTWNSFVKRAGKSLDTDDDKTAWSKIFAAVINSEFLVKEVVAPYIKSQRQGEYTFLLAGIPLEARDKLEMVASQANLTPDLMVALMYDAAMHDQFHALSLRPIEEHTGFHVMIVTGITTETWEAWGKASKKLKEVTGEDVRPENFLGFILEKALWGEISITSNDPEQINQKAANQSVPPVQPKQDEEIDIMALKNQVDNMIAQMEANKRADKDN